MEQDGPLGCETEGCGPADQIRRAKEIVRVNAGAASFIDELDHHGTFEAQTEARRITVLGGKNYVVQRTSAMATLGWSLVAVVEVRPLRSERQVAQIAEQRYGGRRVGLASGRIIVNLAVLLRWFRH
jgi:hypothetical protein